MIIDARSEKTRAYPMLRFSNSHRQSGQHKAWPLSLEQRENSSTERNQILRRYQKCVD